MKSKIILLVLGLLLFGCSSPGSQEEKNSNVEVVVEKSENIGRRNWVLSPGGDKLVYISEAKNATRVLYLGNKERRDFNSCEVATWLDDNNILCQIIDQSPSILKTDDFIQLPLNVIEASAIPDLDKLLQTTIAIYKYEGEYYSFDTFVPDRNSFFLLTTNPQQNYQVIAENVDEVLEGYKYHIIPRGRVSYRENEYSPNEDYYFVNYDSGLTIYDASTYKTLAVYDYSEQGNLEVGGWAADSSGVYFQPVAGMGMSHLKPGAILKLKVPETYLETTPAP